MSRVFIIAEAGVNHNGSLERAKKMIDAACGMGADAVKFQTFKSDRVVTRTAVKADYQVRSGASGKTQWEMIRALELDETAHRALVAHCKLKRIEFLSTPFDEPSVDFLKLLGVKRLKLPSGEITNPPLLLKAARTGLPIILSTGMSTLAEVEAALGALAFGYLSKSDRRAGTKAFRAAFSSKAGRAILKKKLELLHCTTEYPVPFPDMNLRAIETMKKAFGLPVGLSDHSRGYAIGIASAALGIPILEKHFTLDKNLPGPDHAASLEPQEFKAMVEGIRATEAAMGSGVKRPAASEIKNIPIVRKSLVAAREIRKGDLFSVENVTPKRPGDGLSPFRLWELLGKKSDRDYCKDEAICLKR